MAARKSGSEKEKVAGNCPDSLKSVSAPVEIEHAP